MIVQNIINPYVTKDAPLKLGLNEKQGKYLIKGYETRDLHPPNELSIKLAKLFK